jgi:hypothetical protein
MFAGIRKTSPSDPADSDTIDVFAGYILLAKTGSAMIKMGLL